MATHTKPRLLTLTNLDFPQKVLVVVILATVGFGYLGALANMFAQVAGADGNQTITLDEFPSVYRERGLGGLLQEVQNSMGLDDVIKTYHGSGAGTTVLEASLNGTMRTKILEYYATEGEPDEETKALAESDRLALIEWSHLPEELRKRAYEEGITTNEEGGADFEAFLNLFGEGKEPENEEVELVSLIQDTFTNACISCHSGGGPDAQARKFPMETFDEINAYCVEDHGMSYQQLALTTHIHLLGFSVLFAMTGFLFSLTGYSTWVRAVFAPWTLLLQVVEIACWWLAKGDVLFAYGIFYLGPLIGIGLGIQIFGTLLDLLLRRRSAEAVSTNES